MMTLRTHASTEEEECRAYKNKNKHGLICFFVVPIVDFVHFFFFEELCARPRDIYADA